jgi:transcriptional regulator with XRE-family HTH domain
MPRMRLDPTSFKRRRELAGYTQVGLAEASGVSQTRISRIETGGASVLPPTAARLAETLGCTIADIAEPEPVAS